MKPKIIEKMENNLIHRRITFWQIDKKKKKKEKK